MSGDPERPPEEPAPEEPTSQGDAPQAAAPEPPPEAQAEPVEAVIADEPPVEAIPDLPELEAVEPERAPPPVVDPLPPPIPQPAPAIAAATPATMDEALVEFPELTRADDEPAPQWTEPRSDESIFGEPEIPMPGERPTPPHARDTQRSLDLDLKRIKRTKRFGLVGTIFTVLFVAFVLAPVAWVAVYRVVEAPGTVLMLQRATEGQSIRHNPVSIDRISPNIVRAVIASEDSNFCTHHGFDVAAIQKAMEQNEDGDKTRGASTISQQTAKNLFLWPSRNWIRKGLETYFTSLEEFMWPKRRIMEAYLNAAEWGDGIFGIEAASMARFGVHASDLTPLQAARLAVVLPSPNRWRADSPGPYVRRRSATIVARARDVQIAGRDACIYGQNAR